MAKKAEEIQLDLEETLTEIPMQSAKQKETCTRAKAEPLGELVNCLRNERIIVRHIGSFQ